MIKNPENQLIDPNDIVGKSFGKWTIISYAGKSKYNAICSCGNQSIKQYGEIIHFRSTQCARCRKKEIKAKGISSVFGYVSDGFYGEM